MDYMNYERLPMRSGQSLDAVEADLNLDEVIDAYRKTGLGVLKGGFEDQENNLACPLAAITRAKGGLTRSVNFPSITAIFAHGFAKGFDGEEPDMGEDPQEFLATQYRAGYELGQEVALAIEAGALEEAPDFPPDVPVEAPVVRSGGGQD